MNQEKLVLQKTIEYLSERLNKIPTECLISETIEILERHKGAYVELAELGKKVTQFIDEVKKMSERNDD